MKLIIKSAKIIDSKSPFHNQTVDLLIADGLIEKIGVSLPNDDAEVVRFDNLHISQGWFDSSVSLGEPGYEDRETIANGLNVAAKSGFTAIALQPNSLPIIDNQSQVNFVKNK
ncbi:MAG TPA: dihydroorotase, partial [Flavobacterium sp.]|nr:dihydroorotase [Flavobacterium sp.]